MAKKFLGFTPDQQFTLLSKMGYSGPKDATSMKQFMEANPAAAAKMGSYTQKALEKLNPQPKFAEGGLAGTLDYINQITGQQPAPNTTTTNTNPLNVQLGNVSPTTTPTTTTGTTTPTTGTTSTSPLSQLGSNPHTPGSPEWGAWITNTLSGTTNPTPTTPTTPVLTPEQQALEAQKQQLLEAQRADAIAAYANPMQLVTQAQAAQIQETPDQLIQAGTGQVGTPNAVATQTVADTAQAQAPATTATNTVEAATVAGQTDQVLSGVEAATAQPSKQATVAGQLEGLMAQFEGGGTPPWASGAMRQAMAMMQARGLGASSMAGQAVVQAAMESAIGIASQDAATQAQFEMKNLDNRQQTLIFKTQARINSLLSDQAQENAARQFNASSKNQTDQFFAGLQESVARFNADQINAIRQFNVGQTNSIEQFNASLEAQTDQFNAQNSLVIAQANAQWRQTIATANTVAQNEANMQNAKAATEMTQLSMDALWQRERDLMSFAFQSAENSLDREVQLMLGKEQAKLGYAQLDAEEQAGIGQVIGSIVGGIFG